MATRAKGLVLMALLSGVAQGASLRAVQVVDRDYLMVQGCILLITIGYVVINTLVDILYSLLDPRIRTGTFYGT